MKPILPLCLLGALLTGCASSAPEPAEPVLATPPSPSAMRTALVLPLPPIPPAAQPKIVAHFDQARARELDVVLQPSMTPAAIARIHDADRRARSALRALGEQRKAVTEPVLDDARAAVSDLEAALDAAGS